MNHITENILNELLDRSLSPSEEAEFRSHLSGCEECRQLFTGYEKLHTQLYRIKIEEAPASINNFIMSKILSPKRIRVSHKKFLLTIFSIFGLSLSLMFWFIVDQLPKFETIDNGKSLFTTYKELFAEYLTKIPLLNSLSADNVMISAILLFVMVSGVFIIYERFSDIKKLA